MISVLRPIWFVARNDLRFAFRDKSLLLWLILMPPVFMYFIGSMTASGPGAIMTESRVAIFAAEGDTEAQRLAALIRAQGFIHDPDSTKRLTITGRRAVYDAGLPSPSTQIETLRLQIAAASLTAELAVLAARADGNTLEGLANEPRGLVVNAQPAGQRAAIPTGFDQAVPGILVMFTMLVLLTSGGLLLLAEREAGVLRRLASAPLSRGEIVAGKWLGRMLLATAQVAFAMAVGTLFFGMDWGPALPLVAFILLGWAAVCASAGLLIGSLGRSQAEVAGAGMMATMLLAALGGAWWPLEVTPDWMQALQKAVPSGWTMDALHRLVLFGDGGAVVLPHLVALAVTTIALGALAAWRFRFT